MLRVLHIGKYYSPFQGGIENFLSALATCQIEQGNIEPFVLAHQHQIGRIEETETVNGVLVRRARIIGNAVFTPISPGFLRCLNRTIEEQNPDILHLHVPNPSVYWCLLSRKARKRRWVIHWHSDVLGETASWKVRLFYPLYSIFEQALLKRANAVIVTSPPYLDTSVPLENHRSKCSVVPLGIAADSNTQKANIVLRPEASMEESLILQPARPCREKADIWNSSDHPQRPLRLLCIGRLTYYKGHAVLLRALAKTPNIVLEIVGAGEERNALNQLINSLALTHRVRLRGKLTQKDLDCALGDCDLVCLPSIERTEAFGLVLLEAARAGKPALVTRVKGSGMSWVVQDGVTGWTVEPNSVDAMVAALDTVLKSPTELDHRGLLAKQRFNNNFKIKSVEARINQLYLDLTKVQA